MCATDMHSLIKGNLLACLLYGCEIWTPYRRHIKTLKAFHIRCLKSILCIHWWHKVTHAEIRYRAAELVNGQRLPGGCKLQYMHHIRRILNKCNISIAKLEQLSTDRDMWKSACASGLATYNVVADQAAEDRCTRRHNPPNPLTTGLRCPQCIRICASEFGLHSHLRSHVSRPHQQHS